MGMEKVRQIVVEVVRELFDAEVAVDLSRPEARFGDWATNVALGLAGTLGKNPREIAEVIAAKLREQDIFASVDVAGAGFVNLRLSDDYLVNELTLSLDNDSHYRPDTYKNKVVVAEFSDPNPFKVLHMGHFYTSVVGDAISNLVEFAGGKVHRVNFGGDAGLHVAKAMWGIIQNLGGENPEKLGQVSESERADWISKRYVEGNTAYGEDDVAKMEIIAINKRVYETTGNGDKTSDFAKIYWTCRQWSYDYFDKFYDSVGVKFEKYYPESETAELGLKTVREHPEVFTKSDGAIIFDGEAYGLHKRVFVNSEGLPTYETKDMGCTLQKYADYHFDEHIIITANDIIEYMKVVLKSIEQFAPKIALATKHYTHGLLKLPGGIKQSSRLGNAVKAVDILEMVATAQEKQHGNRDQKLILGAIKYAFLKNRLGPDVIFDPENSVSLSGNSGPYLQYASARAKSILRKTTPAGHSELNDELDEFERALVIELLHFKDVAHQAAQELAPHQICSYLYQLAATFNRFYENSKVVGDPRQTLRANLVKFYVSVLDQGLDILGIDRVEKV
jgi:arginyl-tRNA synthetase